MHHLVVGIVGVGFLMFVMIGVQRLAAREAAKKALTNEDIPEKIGCAGCSSACERAADNAK